MNVSSDTLGYPINPQRRLLPNKHSSMFIRASPVAVNNKIKAIQTRKSRINIQSYYDMTDIRPLNINHSNGITNSLGTFTNLSPEKLLERSKDIRLGKINPRQNGRPSVLSTTTIANQQSLLWPSQNSQMGFAKQSQVNSSLTFAPTINKSTTGHMPDIQQRTNRIQSTPRQPLTGQENLMISIDTRNKSLSKTKSVIPRAYRQTISKSKSPKPISHAQPLHAVHNDQWKQVNNNTIIELYQSEEEEEENTPVFDPEFDEYFQKSIIKCAEWLIKYVFDKQYDEIDE